MLSPAIIYLRIKLSKEMPGAEMGSSLPMEEEMMMGSKPGLGMSMGSKPGAYMKEDKMGGKPGLGMSMGSKPGASMKDQIGAALRSKLPSMTKDMEITPDEMLAAEDPTQEVDAPRLPSSMGFLANTFR